MLAGISVIICCYNSVARIEPTLKHLYAQKGIPASDWEIILVDNGSTDSTAATALQLWNSLEGEKPAFKVLQEPIPGLSAARQTGIDAATFEFVLFCDDDNWLDQDYVATGLAIMVSNSAIGALGGTGNPVFEEKEPPYFWKNQYRLLAVGKQSQIEGDITDERQVLYGAGMILRKTAFTELKDKYKFRFILSDRIGKSLMAGGDHELCLALKRIGYRIHYSHTLQFKHFIPGPRTSISYYQKLCLGFGVAYAMMHVYRVEKDGLGNFQNDYRYICIRSLKNIILLQGKLFIGGYYLKKDKYKFVESLQQLHSNIGVFTTFLKIKNQFKQQFLTEPLFNGNSYKNNS